MRHILQGPCLHGEYARCEITDSDHFELYWQSKKPARISIKVIPENISVQDHLVSIRGNGAYLHVVEHLFSALYGMDIFGIRVEVWGPALPIFDGSSGAYAEVLEHCTCVPFERVKLDRPVMVSERESFIQYEPSIDDALLISMGLTHEYIGSQHYSLSLDHTAYRQEIAPARTFVYTDETDPRLRKLPPYGIGITEKRLYSAEPLRYLDEPVRHKILDLLGDMFILQKRLCGTIRAFNTFHELNHRFITRVMEIL